MPSSTRPIRLIAPVACSKDSTRVVLPEPAGPTRTTLRMASGVVGWCAAVSAAPAPAGLPDMGPPPVPGLPPAVLAAHQANLGCRGTRPPPSTHRRAGTRVSPVRSASIRGGPGSPLAVSLSKGAYVDDARAVPPVLDQRLQAGGARPDEDRCHARHGHHRRHDGRRRPVRSVFFPRGELLIGVLVITAFVFSDLIDGYMARTMGVSSKWGAFLDSTLDRLGDAAIFAGLAIWLFQGGDDRLLAYVALWCLVMGSVTSYARAKAESLGMQAKGGIAERSDRLVAGAGDDRAVGHLRRADPADPGAVGAGGGVARSRWCSGWCSYAGRRSSRSA